MEIHLDTIFKRHYLGIKDHFNTEIKNYDAYPFTYLSVINVKCQLLDKEIEFRNKTVLQLTFHNVGANRINDPILFEINKSFIEKIRFKESGADYLQIVANNLTFVGNGVHFNIANKSNDIEIAIEIFQCRNQKLTVNGIFEKIKLDDNYIDHINISSDCKNFICQKTKNFNAGNSLTSIQLSGNYPDSIILKENKHLRSLKLSQVNANEICLRNNKSVDLLFRNSCSLTLFRTSLNSTIFL